MDLGRELRRLCDLLCGPDRAEIFSDLASRLRHGSGAGRARLRIDLDHGRSGSGDISRQTLRQYLRHRHVRGAIWRRGGSLGHRPSARPFRQLYLGLCDRHRRQRIVRAGDLDGLSRQDQGGCRPVAPDTGAGWRRPVTAPSMGLPMPLACGLNPPPNDSRLHPGPMNEHVQTATTEPLFHPLSPRLIRDPYPHYQRLRTTDPMHLTPHGMFVASRHAEASLVLRDKRFGKDYVERSVRRYGPKIMEEPVFRSMSHWMLQQDPPYHTPLRGLAANAFTARRVEDMRPRIQQIVDQTLDAIIGQGKMDLIEDFAFRLPVTIICDMLGIPEDHREAFYKRSRDGGRLLDPVPLTPAEIAAANAGNMMARMYFQQLFELRRKNPGDDLPTQLVHAEEDGSKLSNEELTANIILLFGAGHETTVNLIGNGLLALYRNPDQLALLKANPSLITNAIEGFLR